jgi:hypothetical protein
MTTHSKGLEGPSDISDKNSSPVEDRLSTLPALTLTGALASPAQNVDHDTKAEHDDDTSSETSAYIPQKYRWIAFSMIIFFATGSGFAEGTLGPLKSTLVKQLKINSKYFAPGSAIGRPALTLQMLSMVL